MLNIKDLLDTTLRMIMKYSRVKYFDCYADFESSLYLGIWLNREDHNSLAERVNVWVLASVHFTAN